MTAVIHKPISQLKISWPLLPDDFILPDDPVDNIEHPLIASALRQSVLADSELMLDALAVTNLALCAAIDDRTICKAPDCRKREEWNEIEIWFLSSFFFSLLSRSSVCHKNLKLC